MASFHEKNKIIRRRFALLVKHAVGPHKFSKSEKLTVQMAALTFSSNHFSLYSVNT